MTAITPRNQALDGLRGFNALFVVTWHIYLILLPTLDWVAQKTLYTFPVSLLLSGTQAVVCFFILSGFVLTQSTKNVRFSWKAYYPKRIIRLYVPVAVAYLFAAALILLIPRTFPPDGVNGWLTGANYDTVTWETLFKNLTFQDTLLNNPTWSIVYEIIFSLTLPLWILVFRRTTPLIGLLCAAGLYGLIWVGMETNNTPLTWYPVFGIGVLLSIHFDKIKTIANDILVTKHSRAYQWAIPLLGIFLFAYPGETDAPTRFITQIGALILIVAALTSPIFQKLLETKLALFLGKISFSLYLAHVPILVTVFMLLPKELIFYTPAITIPLSLLIAALLTKVVDTPATKLGNQVGNWFATRIGNTSSKKLETRLQLKLETDNKNQ